MQIRQRQNEANFNKKLQNQSFPVQTNIEIKMQAIPKKCKTGKIRHKTWPQSEKNQFM